jgi:protein gp37
VSARTAIEWTDRTWNPFTGCTKVSAGCDHCYAERLHERFHGAGSFAQVTTHPDRYEAPLTWRAPSLVFVNSMSDVFHPALPDDDIARVFAVMALAGRHTFQILTKRHARMRAVLGSDAFHAQAATEVRQLCRRRRPAVSPFQDAYEDRLSPWPLPNVWLGVSVETQRWADIRVPALLGTPAAVRWVSAEPLLGPVVLDRWLRRPPHPDGAGSGGTDHHAAAVDSASALAGPDPDGRRLDWVVGGGESGPGARPMHPDWARSLRDQCATSGTAFLFKEWGAHDPAGHRIGKKRAGRVLDGVLHDEYPEPSPITLSRQEGPTR